MILLFHFRQIAAQCRLFLLFFYDFGNYLTGRDVFNMDISTIIGLLVSIGGIVAGYMMDQGQIMALLGVSPFLIVVIGTIGVVITSFGLGDVANAFKALFASYSKKNS